MHSYQFKYFLLKYSCGRLWFDVINDSFYVSANIKSAFSDPLNCAAVCFVIWRYSDIPLIPDCRADIYIFTGVINFMNLEMIQSWSCGRKLQLQMFGSNAQKLHTVKVLSLSLLLVSIVHIIINSTLLLKKITPNGKALSTIMRHCDKISTPATHLFLMYFDKEGKCVAQWRKYISPQVFI